MPKLIVGNVDNESMVGDLAQMTPLMRAGSSIVANRLLWLVEEGDAILTPYPISDSFLAYVCGLIGVDARTIGRIVPPGGETESQLLTFAVLSDPELLTHIAAVVKQPSEWRLLPYFFDRATAWLSRHLGMGDEPAMRTYMRQGGSDQLNSKVAFRRIAAGHDIPVAEGYVCSSPAEVRAALHDLISITGAVIVKQDLNAGGDGNFVITTGREQSMVGAAETLQIAQTSELDALTDQLWRRLIGKRNADLIIEAYYPLAVPYYSELDIPLGGRRPYLLNFGEMRMEPVWIGFEIPGRTLTPFQIGDLAANSMKLADIARTMGYTGKINIDAIKTQDGRILFTEVNGRLGGCTHIDVTARRLLGSDYLNRYTLLSRNKVRTGRFEHVLRLLDEQGLLYTPARGQGALILTEDTNRTGTVEYMVVAPDSGQAYELEKVALEVMHQSCDESLSFPRLV